jgi:hypothetical protein
VENIPARVQETLASQSSLIIAGQSDSPMLASPDVTRGVLLAQAENAAALKAQFDGNASPDFAPIATLDGALPAKVTAAFTASTWAMSGGRDRIVIRVARSDIPATLPSVQNTDPILDFTIEVGRGDTSTTSQPSFAQMETAVLKERVASGGHDQFAVIVPLPFKYSLARALIAFIDVAPSATAASLAQCQADLDASAKLAAQQPDTAAVEGSAQSAYDIALQALWQPADRRSALVFLASQTSAHICEDTALVADDATLEKLAITINWQACSASSTVPHTAAALSWLLDRAAFQLLVLNDAPVPGPSTTPAAPAPLPPELRAVLTIYAGEPARHGGSLDDIAHQSTSRQDLENRLTAENLVFLTDASPASRVRAYDWLKARGLAPAGFDPLGPAKERREALDKALPASSD